MAKKQAQDAGAPSLEMLARAAQAPGASLVERLRWGWALYAAGRFGEAADAARECQANGVADAEVSYLLGMALKASGDVEGASRAFHAAAEQSRSLSDPVRGAMLRRLAVGQVNWLERGEWALEPETWVRT